MIVNNILRYKKRSIKLIISFLAMVFALSVFLFIKEGYSKIYEDRNKIDLGQYYIKVDSIENIPLYTNNVELITSFGYCNYYNSESIYLDNSDLKLSRDIFILTIDYDNFPSYLLLENKKILFGNAPQNDDDIIINRRIAKMLSELKNCQIQDLIGMNFSINDSMFNDMEFNISCIVTDSYFDNWILNSIRDSSDFSAQIIFSHKLDENFVNNNSYNKYSQYMYLNGFELLDKYISYFDENQIKFEINNYFTYQKTHYILAQYDIINTILFIILITVVFICITNFINTLHIKYNEQKSYIKMLRFLGFSKIRCNIMFYLENYILYSVSFLLGIILSIITIVFLNNNILIEADMMLKISLIEYTVISIIVYFGNLIFISIINLYVVMKNK